MVRVAVLTVLCAILALLCCLVSVRAVETSNTLQCLIVEVLSVKVASAHALLGRIGDHRIGCAILAYNCPVPEPLDT